MALMMLSPSGPTNSNAPILVGGVTWDGTACKITGGGLKCPQTLIPPQYVGHPGLGLGGVQNNQLYPIDPSILVPGTGNVSVGVDLIGLRLTAVADSSLSNQGASVSPLVAQSSGIIYWEMTWTNLADPGLAGGIGVCSLEAEGQYDGLASSGSGGFILRPNGDCLVNGTVHTGFFPAQAQGDVVGFTLTFNQHTGFTTIDLFGCKGACLGNIVGPFIIPTTAYLPCVAFGSPAQNLNYAVTANFGAGGFNSFSGPVTFPTDLVQDGLIFGWPNKAQ